MTREEMMHEEVTDFMNLFLRHFSVEVKMTLFVRPVKIANASFVVTNDELTTLSAELVKLQKRSTLTTPVQH